MRPASASFEQIPLTFTGEAPGMFAPAENLSGREESALCSRGRRGGTESLPRERKGSQGFCASITPHYHQGRLPREYTLAGDFSYIDLCPLLFELLGFLAHTSFERLDVIETFLRRVLAHILGD